MNWTYPTKPHKELVQVIEQPSRSFESNHTCDECEKWLFGTCERWNTHFPSGQACDMISVIDDELRDRLLNH